MRWRVVASLLVAMSARAAAQAAVGHAVGCDLCHGGHVPRLQHAGRLVLATRTNGTSPAVVAPAGLTVLSLSCLRCHYSTSVRTTEMTAAQLAATGGAAAGKYVGATLFTSHPMGASGRPQCKSCHLVHVAGMLRPIGTQERALCTACHTDRVSHPDQSHLTQACSTCHRVHTTNFGRVAGGTIATLGAHTPDVYLSVLADGGHPVATRARAGSPGLNSAGMQQACMGCHLRTAATVEGPAATPGLQVTPAHAEGRPCVACHRMRQER